MYLLAPERGKAAQIATFDGTLAATVDPGVSGDILLQAIGSSLQAIQLPGGDRLWQYESGAAGIRPPTVSADTVLWLTDRASGQASAPGARGSTLQALELAPGRLRWQAPLDGVAISGGVAAANGQAFTSTPPAAYDLATGERRWQAVLDGETVGGPVWQTMVRRFSWAP